MCTIKYIEAFCGRDNVSACGTPWGGEVVQGDKEEELYIFNEQASNSVRPKIGVNHDYSHISMSMQTTLLQ